MKKRLYLIAAAAIALVACTKEEATKLTESTIPGAKRIVLGATFELPTDATKSDYDAAGNFYWSSDDAIWIGSDITSGASNWGSGPIISGTENMGPGYATAQFDCTMFSDVTAVAAVFPKTVQPYYASDSLYLTLPKTIAWTATQLENPANATMQVDNIMVARFVDIYDGGYARGTTEDIQFHNVGGLFCLTLKNVPYGAEKLVFTTDKKINGTFTVGDVVEVGEHYPVINTAATDVADEKSTTITFATITNGENKMTFFIPVPVGSYVIGFDVQDGEGNSLWSFSASKANGVERGHIVKMPTLSHVIVGGSGAGATNIITTPTGFSGDVPLPSTLNNIYVRMNETDGTINLKYSADPALHPANVYIQALGDVNTLNINLPDSHVELTGEDSVQHVITNVSSYTSFSTLKVDNKVKIGKDEEENSGITITGGSLDLGATVEGTVTVDIPATAANTTENKVAININNSIKKLDVKRAAYSDKAADKIYVSLSIPETTEQNPVEVELDGLNVDEVNCNLYVAPGVVVKDLSTKAAENTVEGDIVTLSATGASTIVTVTSEATVTSAITATEGATIIVDEDAVGEGAETTTDTNKGSTITTVDTGSVALIGNTGYPTLAGAIAAAEDGATITIIKAGEYDALPALTKTLTFVPSVDGVIINQTTNAEIAAGKTVTFKNIAFNLSDVLYLGFGKKSDSANGALVMEGCTIEGSLSLYGISTFTDCKFTANGKYNIWAVLSNATFTGCSFSNTNRAVNVYDFKHSSDVKTVSFSNCSFTGTAAKKAAINIHHNPDGTVAKYAVTITDCTTIGTWASSVAETGEPADATICNSALWMVSDIENWTNGDITVNGVNVYDAPVAQIGTTTYTTLEAAVAAAKSGDTITLLSDVDLSSHARSASDDIILEGITLDLNGKTIRGYNNGVRYSGTGAVIKNGTFGFVDSEQKPNYGLSIGSCTDGATISDDITLENIKVVGGINIDLANVTMNNVDIDMIDATFYAIWVDEDGAVATYNSGTINGGANATAIFGVAPPTGDATDAIRITGGTVKTNGEKFRLTGKYLPVEVSGGLFDVQVPADCCAEGYEPTTEPDANGMYTVTPAAPKVAQIGDSYYATLAEAFAAVPAGTPTTITMIANAMINVAGSALTVPTNKDITLDLNGFQVVGTAETGNTSALITNNGTLTIKDSSDSNADGTGTGKLISGATPTWKWDGSDNFSGSYASNTITNCGTLTIESGYLQNTSDGSATYTVDNNSGSRTATLNVNGGYLTAVKTVVRQFCNSTTNQNTVNITAGSIATSGYAGIWTQLPGSNNQEKLATLNVTGGTVSAASYAWYDYSFGDSFAAVNYAISGGTFTGWLYSYAVNKGVKPGFITGGTFSTDPSEYVAAGYKAVQSGNNWNVKVKNYTCTVYTPSTNLSGSLDAPVVSRVRKDEAVINFGSFSNLEAGQVIELTEDVYYNGTVSIPAGVVLDFNGHKLTATKVSGLNGNAILQNTLPYNDGQPNMDAYVNVSYEGDVENVEIHGGTYTFNPQTYTPSGIGVVVDGTRYDAPGLYFVPSIPEALVYYADYNFISKNLGEVTIDYNGSFGKDENGNISSSAGTFVFNGIKKSESINDAFIFQMNPQEEYATSQSYNDWICDYVVSVKEGENGTPEEPGLGLWGMYGGMTVGFGIGFDLAANEKYPLISSLGLNFNFNYAGIKNNVSPFICGTLPFADDLIGKTLYVDLCLFPAEGFDSSKVNKDQNYKYIVVKRFEYKFGIIGGGAAIEDTDEEF